MMKNVLFKGMLEGKEVYKRDNPVVAFDGRKLDTLHVMATFTNQQEVKDVIDFLTVHQWCFENPKTNQ